MFQPSRPFSVFFAAACLAVGSAFAQDSGPQAAQPLSGPKVTENKIPGVHQTFGQSSKAGPGRRDARSISPEIIKRALSALDRDDTPAEARLTDSQRSRIASLVSEFKSSVESYKQAHKSEAEQARRTIDRGSPGKPRNKQAADRPSKQPSDADAPMQSGESEEVAAARATLEELRKNAPDPVNLQTQVWQVLSEPQQAIVQTEAARLIRVREDTQAREYVRRRLNKQGGPGDLPALSADGSINLDRLPEKMKQRLEQMSPEDREKALAKLRERIKNGEAPARSKRKAPPEGSPKPPPSMDEVVIPDSDDAKSR